VAVKKMRPDLRPAPLWLGGMSWPCRVYGDLARKNWLPAGETNSGARPEG
jgi:hypothetical protein